MDLRDTVHGGGSHDGLIGSHDLGSRGTEGTNGGGDVKTELVLAGNLDDVLRTVDVDLESLGHENWAKRGLRAEGSSHQRRREGQQGG